MTTLTGQAGRTARALVGAGVLRIAAEPANRATWRSWRGLKTPLVYSAARLGLDPAAADIASHTLQAAIRSNYPATTLVVGAGTGGASLAPLVARDLGLPHAVDLALESDETLSDLQDQHPDARVVVLDHLLLDGADAETCIRRISSWSGVDVLVALHLVSVGERSAGGRAATELAYLLGVPFRSVLDVGVVLDAAIAARACSSAQAEQYARFLRDPDRHQWDFGALA